ncbi:MAG: glycyl-radical enzyme activating protein [Bacteroidales bacterium]
MATLVFNIQRYCIHDGPGIRQTIFLKGCPLHCIWCHNPESQSKSVDINLKVSKVHSYTFLSEDKIGESYSIEDLQKEILKDELLYEESNGGVTFSGGEPLMHPEFMKSILRWCNQMNIHTALDTCGYGNSDTLLELLPFTNLFLFDIKSLDPLVHKEYCGVDNHLILDNLLLLDSKAVNMELRFPLIPTVNNRDQDFILWKDLYSKLKGKYTVTILPFHRLGKHKYESLGKKYMAEHLNVPTESELQQACYKLETIGFQTKTAKVG